MEGWVVEVGETPQGGYGYTDADAKRIIVAVAIHESWDDIEETLVHEMAHAATDLDHGPEWRKEMERVKAAGAPTSALDFLDPYSCRDIVTSFIDAARSGASWDDALNELKSWLSEFGSQRARIVEQARKLFEVAKNRTQHC